MHHSDLWGDSNFQQLHHIFRVYDVPEFVKRAEADDTLRKPEEPLAVTAFADPLHRKYPMTTPAMTWLSTCYFIENVKQAAASGVKRSRTPEDQVILGRLTKAAAFWGIEPAVMDLFSCVEKQAAATVEGLDDEDFALVVDWEGKKERRFPIVNPASIKSAATRLYEDRAMYPWSWRQHAASRIINRADELGVDLGENRDYIAKAAGLGFATGTTIGGEIAKRITHIQKTAPDTASKMAVFAKTAMISEPSPELSKTAAAMVDAVDRSFGLHKLYRRGLPTPEELFYGTSLEKLAAVKDSVIQLTTGTVYNVSDLQNLDLEKIARILGDDIYHAVNEPGIGIDFDKFAEVVKTLPVPDARLLETAIGESIQEAV